MIQMGLELAHSGAECYLIDLPGHGASLERFTPAASRRAVQEVSNWILNGSSPARGCPEEDLFLIGHSLGGGLAIENARKNDCASGVIAVSPASVPVSRNSPPHLLILYGENDFPFVRRGAVFLFEEVTGIPIPFPDKPRFREDSKKTHTLVPLQWTEHSGGLFLPGAHREIKNWINRTAQYSSLDSENNGGAAARVILNGVLCIVGLASWFPGFSLIASGLLKQPSRLARPMGFSSNRIDRAQKLTTGFETYGAYMLFSFVTLVMLKWFAPWDRLHLLGGGFLTGFLCLTGMALFGWRTPPVNALNSSWRGVACSVAGLLLLVLYPLALVSRYFVYLDLTSVRLWRLPIIVLCTLPFFLWDEWVFRIFLSREGKWKLTNYFLSTRLILGISLMFGFYLLKSTDFLVLLLLPGLALMSLLGWMCSGWVFSKTQNCAASALFSSLCTGWIFGIFFPQF